MTEKQEEILPSDGTLASFFSFGVFLVLVSGDKALRRKVQMNETLLVTCAQPIVKRTLKK